MKFNTGDHTTLYGQGLAKTFTLYTGHIVNPPYSAIGFYKNNGELGGVAIFSNYTGSCIEIHVYTPGMFKKYAIKYVFNYIFNQLQCNCFIAKPHKSNKILCSILDKMDKNAFKCELPMYYGPSSAESAMVYLFTKDFAEKWIKLNAKSA